MAVVAVAQIHLEPASPIEKGLKNEAIFDRDSGHWSDIACLPFEGLTDEELTSECGQGSSRGSQSRRSSTKEEEEAAGAVIPPAPPIPEEWNKRLASHIEMTIQYEPDTGSLDSIYSYYGHPVHPTLSRPVGEPKTNEDNTCIVCFDPEVVVEEEDWSEWDWNPQVIRISSHKVLPCCRRTVCKVCLETIIKSNVDEGRVAVSCPHPECGKPFSKDYILENSNADTMAKFNRFVVDIENDGKRKTCPNCCQITEHSVPRRAKEADLKITCSNCTHEWCFRCHAPWHRDATCKQFQKGNKQFRQWTKGQNARGIANCQKCPTCLVYIQRSSGCNHMTCNRCSTEFCYYCGDRFLELGIIDHDSTLNVWGCPNNYHPNEPVLRKLVRGGYLGAKVSYLAGVPVLFVGACALVVVAGAIILPIYGGIKLYNIAKFKRDTNRRKRRH